MSTGSARPGSETSSRPSTAPFSVPRPDADRFVPSMSPPPFDFPTEPVLERDRRLPAELAAQSSDVGPDLGRLVGRERPLAEADQVEPPDPARDRLDDLPDRRRRAGSDVDRAVELAGEDQRQRIGDVVDMNVVAPL